MLTRLSSQLSPDCRRCRYALCALTILATAGLHACSDDATDNPSGSSAAGQTGTSNDQSNGTTGGSPVNDAGGASLGASGATAGTGGASPTGGSSAACPDLPGISGTHAIYDLATSQSASADSLDFFDYPWPELARTLPELARFPNPSNAVGCDAGSIDPTLAPLVTSVNPRQYRSYIAGLAGNFLTQGPNSAAIYIRFDGPLSSVLPTPLQSIDLQSSPIVLVNLEDTAVRERVVPVLTRVFESSRYLKPHTLSILPHPGFSLEPGARYAAVVRRSLLDAAGNPLGTASAFEMLKRTDACASDPDHARAFTFIRDKLGIALDSIAAAAVFQAGRPTDALSQTIHDIEAVNAPSVLANPEVTSTTLQSADGFYQVDGSFETLLYQNGNPPYLPSIGLGVSSTGQPVVNIGFDSTSPAGQFVQGLPPPSAAGGTDTTVPRTERIALRLTIPVSLTLTDSQLLNVPVAIYGAGTGGTINDPIDAGVAQDLATLGIAVFSTTPVLHFERAHTENIDPNLLATLAAYDQLTGQQTENDFVTFVQSGDLFFNPLNLQAAKGNSLQAAIDYAWQARWLAEARLTASIDGVTRTIGFDPARIYFFGHSQGGSTGPLLESSSYLSAMTLSAPSGHLPSNLLGKTQPSNIVSVANMIGYIVCDDPSEPLDVQHPFLNLLMHWFEQADAVNYVPLLIGEATSNPKHVFVIGGTEDHLAAPASHDAVTTGARLQQLAPELVAVPGQGLLAALLPNSGYGTTYASLSGNLTAQGMAVTGAFRQYHDPTCRDDHFVFQCNAQARSDWADFFATLSPTKAPTVP